MKQSILIVYSFILLIMGCKDNPTSPYGVSPIVTSFQGKFVDWNKGDNHKILFLGANDVWNSDKIYASSNIDSTGYFSIINLDVPSASWLINPAYPVYSEDREFQEYSLTCSDSNAKVVYGVLIIVNDTSNNRVAEVYRQNFNYNFWLNEELLKSGDFMSEYIYADRDVNLKGKIKYIYFNTSFNKEWRMTYKYNLNFKKGWNQRITYIVSYNVSYDEGKTVVTAEINYIYYEPTLANWHYYYY